METNTQVILNNLDSSNKNSIDWNHLGCIALAYLNNIHIIDATNLKILKTLSPQSLSKSVISKLKWSTSNLNSNKNIYPHLASATDDLISIWDINESRIVGELFPNENNQSTPNNKVVEMRWLSSAQTTNKNNNSNTLLSLYSNSKLIIWNTESSCRIWQKNINDQRLHGFTFDHHDFLRLAFLGSNFINFLKLDSMGDSNLVEKWQRKFYLASNDASAHIDSNAESPRRSSINLFSSYWKKSVDTKPNTSQSIQQKALLKECFQIEFHPNVKNILFLVYPREIFVFDLTIYQTIGFIQTDKVYSPFQQIYPCHQADAFYALHENGSLSVHGRCKDSIHQYELIANTEQKRLPKNCSLFGLSVCPNTERFCSMILSDGRILKYELFGKKDKTLDREDLFLFEIMESKKRLKLMLVSMLDSISSSSFVAKMGPRLTKKNCKFWYPLMAIGDSIGYLSIFNLNLNKVDRKIALSTNPLMGIEWITLSSLIAWSFNSNMSLSVIESFNNSQNKQQILVKNDVFYVDLRTGESALVRTNQIEESPITAVKISHL
ncbi:WD repeat-containing 11-like, partial [Brachionus plicatilis]